MTSDARVKSVLSTRIIESHADLQFRDALPVATCSKWLQTHRMQSLEGSFLLFSAGGEAVGAS
jgi:hypothetical protein